jgi:SRSO17 transposase
MEFHRRFHAHFQGRTRRVVVATGEYLKGLMQAERKNMERMEEAVRGCDEQRLQHMLTSSPWDHRAVLDQVAMEADARLRGQRRERVADRRVGLRQEERPLGGGGAAVEKGEKIKQIWD